MRNIVAALARNDDVVRMRNRVFASGSNAATEIVDRF